MACHHGGQHRESAGAHLPNPLRPWRATGQLLSFPSAAPVCVYPSGGRAAAVFPHKQRDLTHHECARTAFSDPQGGLFRTGFQYLCIYRLFRGVDDVCGAGHPHQGTAGPERNPVWPADGHAGADGVAGAGAAGHLDRPFRWPHRAVRADALHRTGHLADVLRHRILAVPRAVAVRGSGRGLVLGGHALRGPLVPAGPAGAGHGHLRGRQLRLGHDQVHRPAADRLCRHLDLRAEGL